MFCLGACLSGRESRSNSVNELGVVVSWWARRERIVWRKIHACPFHFNAECSLADYVSGLQSEKVPFVFLPAQGQLINPQAEIALSGNTLEMA